MRRKPRPLARSRSSPLVLEGYEGMARSQKTFDVGARGVGAGALDHQTPVSLRRFERPAGKCHVPRATSSHPLPWRSPWRSFTAPRSRILVHMGRHRVPSEFVVARCDAPETQPLRQWGDVLFRGPLACLLAAPVKRPRPVASSGSHNRGPPIISTAMGSSAVSSAGLRRGTPRTLSQTSARAWVLRTPRRRRGRRATTARRRR